MANQRQSTTPGDRKSEFLGGGVQFNKVGASIPGAQSQIQDEEPVTVIAAEARAGKYRTALIVAALLVLGALLYIVSNDSLGGVTHAIGHGGVSPTVNKPAPSHDF